MNPLRSIITRHSAEGVVQPLRVGESFATARACAGCGSARCEARSAAGHAARIGPALALPAQELRLRARAGRQHGDLRDRRRHQAAGAFAKPGLEQGRRGILRAMGRALRGHATASASPSARRSSAGAWTWTANISSTRRATRIGVPRLQLIESHRISDCDRNDTEDGIGFDAYGAPGFYRVQLDDGKFRDLPGALMLHVFEPESASAVRNAPDVAALDQSSPR